MGMYDELSDLGQVKCFGGDLKMYTIGDKLPCQENGLPSNIILLSLEISHAGRLFNWRDGSIAIIENSIYEQYIEIESLSYEETALFEGKEVVDSGGLKLKISNTKDLFEYIKDRRIYEKMNDIIEIRYEKWQRDYPDSEYYDNRAKIHKDIMEKWYM